MGTHTAFFNNRFPQLRLAILLSAIVHRIVYNMRKQEETTRAHRENTRTTSTSKHTSTLDRGLLEGPLAVLAAEIHGVVCIHSARQHKGPMHSDLEY